MSELVRMHILLPSQYQIGLCAVLDFAEDIIVDVPGFWLYVGEITSEFNMFFSLLCFVFLAY